MHLFWKLLGICLLTAVLGLVLSAQRKEFAFLLNLAACTMVAAASVTILKPVVLILKEAASIAELSETFNGILLQCAGISIACELGSTICTDAGNSSIGKLLHLVGTATVFSLSIPALRELLEQFQMLLGGIG